MVVDIKLEHKLTFKANVIQESNDFEIQKLDFDDTNPSLSQT
jgi:hypothetical protein